MDLFSVLSNETLWTAVGSIGTVAALGYLAQQNIAMKRSLKFDSQWRKKEKAVELASFYSCSIMPRISYCMGLFRATGIDKKLGSIDSSKMQRFTLSELKSLHTAARSLRKNVIEDIGSTKDNVFDTLRDCLPESFRKHSDLDLSAKDRHTFLVHECLEISSGLLNDLEYFSMCINTGVADGDVIYQSLHQTFFDTVQIFYYQIASCNVSAKDKYYTHIIELYKAWKRKYQSAVDKEESLEDTLCTSYSRIQ